MAAGYVPKEGDVVWVDFSPQAGHEQAGHRPAVVISNAAYNRRVGLMICCPMTTKIKGFPFEVPVAGRPGAVALADQVRTFDWRARTIKKKSSVLPAELAEIRSVHAMIVGIDAPAR